LLPPADDAAPVGSADPAVPAALEPEELTLGTPAMGLAGRLYWWLTLSIIACDQAAKAAIHARLPIFDSVTVIAGLVDFTHVENKGVAFGLLNDAPMGVRLKTVVTFARAGLSLILGGAAGNLIDRLSRGFVIDFVDVYWRGWHFWAFNVADASITIGAALVFIDLLVVSRHASHSV
jgi:signal peptidase II